MSCSNFSSEWSRSVRAAPRYSSAFTVTVISPRSRTSFLMLAPRMVCRLACRVSRRWLIRSGPRDGVLAPDLGLQLQDAVQQRLRGGRAAGHVDVDRHDAVAAAHHRIAVVVVAAAIGAAAHADDPARFGH